MRRHCWLFGISAGCLLALPATAHATVDRAPRPAQETPICEQDLPAATDGTLTLDTPSVQAGTSGLAVLTEFEAWPVELIGGGSGETFLSCTPWSTHGEAEVMPSQDAALFLFEVPPGIAPGTYPVSVLFYEDPSQPGGAATIVRLGTTFTVTDEPAWGTQDGPACALPGSRAPEGELLSDGAAGPGDAVTLTLSGVPTDLLGQINEYDDLWFVSCISGFATPVVHEATPPGAFHVQLPPGMAPGVHTVRTFGLLRGAVVWWEAEITVADPATPAVGTVTVHQASCASITASGSGWGQTDATVELAVPPSEGGESRADVVAGPVQVFLDADGAFPATELRFADQPVDGRYAVVVLVDDIVRAQSRGFELSGCGAALPATGSWIGPMAAAALASIAAGLVLVHRSRTARFRSN